MNTFFGLYFNFCLELALETWAKASLTQSLWVHHPNHTHSLASFQLSGLSDQQVLHLTECCLQVPYKGREVVPEPVCAYKVRNGPTSLTKAFLLSAKAAVMCTAPRAETRPPPPIPPFLLAQNLFSKRIMPTDKMRPKSDQMASSVVKGLN